MPHSVSVLLPAYNESENLLELIPRVVDVLERLAVRWEVVVVDDGSTDDTPTTMAKFERPEVRSIRLRRNSGKSAALSAGLAEVAGDVVVLMDADGQDDPEELPILLAAIDDGHDLVTGRRAVRNDRFVKRTTSKLYNGTTALVTGVPGRDFNSGFKAMTGELAASLELYGELHRYIPVMAHWNGFRVCEVDVDHHARRHGSTKYGWSRFWRGFLDLMTVKFLTTYTARPFHLFGGLGVATGMAGAALLLWMLVLRIQGEAIGNRPALLTGVLLVVIAVQMVFFGLLGELIVHLRRSSTLDAMRDERWHDG